MNPSPDGERTLRVDALARVEGEGAMRLVVRDGQVRDVALEIYEPPRFFEAMLQGRGYAEAPDITARICGICPVAYQMSACQAMESAFGIEVGEPVRRLRRLLYCGEWVESHALHIYMLHAPDFLGYDGAVEMAKDHRSVVETGLRVKKAGNEILRVVGGRSVHPVNVKVGGFYRVPTRDELAALRPVLEQARDDAVETVRLVSGFDFPDFEHEHPYLALRSPDGGYPLERGTVVTTLGDEFEASRFEDRVTEHHVDRSNALHATLNGVGPYLVGPMARFALNSASLSPLAKELAREAGIDPGCRNPYRSIVVRAIELVYAVDEALRLLGTLDGSEEPSVHVEVRPGRGYGVTEAPRGLLYHRYDVDETGAITTARIVPPTSQNQAAIESDLAAFAQQHLHLDTAQLSLRCEQAIRNYDPCISCATHFLDLTVEEV